MASYRSLNLPRLLKLSGRVAGSSSRSSSIRSRLPTSVFTPLVTSRPNSTAASTEPKLDAPPHAPHGRTWNDALSSTAKLSEATETPGVSKWSEDWPRLAVQERGALRTYLKDFLRRDPKWMNLPYGEKAAFLNYYFPLVQEANDAVFLRGVGAETTVPEVQRVMEQFGAIKEIIIVNRGHLQVYYEDAEAARKALEYINTVTSYPFATEATEKYKLMIPVLCEWVIERPQLKTLEPSKELSIRKYSGEIDPILHIIRQHAEPIKATLVKDMAHGGALGNMWTVFETQEDATKVFDALNKVITVNGKEYKVEYGQLQIPRSNSTFGSGRSSSNSGGYSGKREWTGERSSPRPYASQGRSNDGPPRPWKPRSEDSDRPYTPRPYQGSNPRFERRDGGDSKPWSPGGGGGYQGSKPRYNRDGGDGERPSRFEKPAYSGGGGGYGGSRSSGAGYQGRSRQD